MWIDSILTQEDIPESISEGSTLQLDRDEGYGVRLVSPLYIRNHLIQRQEFFNAFISDQRRQQLFVAGPPGSGKTVFLSLLARMYAKNQRKKVLYVAYRHGNRCPIILFDRDSVKRNEDFPNSRDLFDAVHDLLKRDPQQYDLVLYVGVRQGIKDSFDVTGLFKGCDSGVSKVVFVTSLLFRIKDCDYPPFADVHIYCKDYFDSWTKEDHLEAMRCIYEAGILPEHIQQDIVKFAKTRAFSDQNEGTRKNRDSSAVDDAEPQNALSHEQILSYVDYKYFYAGGSARFMNDFAIDSLKTKLNDLCESVDYNEQWKAFSTYYIPTGSVGAVNTLMQRFRGRDDVARCAPVSRYIAMVAYDRVGGELVEAVKTVAWKTDNPSLQGWAFELEQLEIIKKVLRTRSDTMISVSSSRVDGTPGLAFRPSREIQFDGIALVKAINGGPLSEKDFAELRGEIVVVWCMKWNQGCFDVAIYHGETETLATLQFTISDSHSLHLEYVRYLRNAFHNAKIGIKNFAHIGINETGAIRWDDATGIGHRVCVPDFEITRSESKPLRSVDRELPLHLVPQGTKVIMYTNKRPRREAEEKEIGGTPMDADE